MLILAIETSCDETAAAVIRDGKTVLSSVVASQVQTHALYGGVVPEIASRQHLESIVAVIDTALADAGVSRDALEGVAVTQGPGLVGALLVGISAAQGVALALRIPLVGLHHIEGHLLAPMLEKDIPFPFVALVASGGHTHIYEVTGIGSYRTIGQTIDDAAGEAFDKVGKLLGLPYPAGPVIDRLAAVGDPSSIRFPRPMIHDDTCNFSFSGLKTAVLTHVGKAPLSTTGADLENLCASFQQAVCDVVVAKTAKALALTGCRRLIVAGGVACNSGLRTAMKEFADREKIDLHIPAPALCGDNAAMLGVSAEYYLASGLSTPLHFLDALPSWRLEHVQTHLRSFHV